MTRWQKFRNWSADKRSKARDMFVNNRVSQGIATLVAMLIAGVKTLTVDLPVAGLNALGNSTYKAFSYVPGFTKAANAVSGFFAHVKARFASKSTEANDFASAAASTATPASAASDAEAATDVTAAASRTLDTSEAAAGATLEAATDVTADASTATPAGDVALDATTATGAESQPQPKADDTPASARASSGDLSVPQVVAAVAAKTPSPGRSTRVGRAAASVASGVRSAGKAMTHALDGVRGRPASNDSGKGSVATPTPPAAASTATPTPPPASTASRAALSQG